MKKKNKPNYVLPAAIKPYAHLITNTGGNDIEDLLTRYYNDDNIMLTNIAVALLGASVESQVMLINNMIEAGLLK